METEAPYPDMTDAAVLEKLLPIALALIDCRDLPVQRLNSWGNILWDIHKYLEKRLVDDTGLELIEPDEEAGGRREILPECAGARDVLEILKEAVEQKGGGGTVNLFYNVESVTINQK